ncbi:TRAM domain-containing protein [Halomicroarcula sp. F27]|uniref:TRAM domain-containing protein n=1 Tax=Haloarcula nitratireducens TaxID=2487749 RepID=A0AAW4PIK4_9EURY|nr:TRAM domain-containing protein [Halomicroarcula nitratireducens]
MEIPSELRCLFSAEVKQPDESFIIEVPADEVQIGELEAGETYQVGFLSTETTMNQSSADSQSANGQRQEPPVEEGETRRVEIANIGEQGDGVARVERGFVVIVPDTEVGERVAVEIETVTETVAFAEVTERISYYE